LQKSSAWRTNSKTADKYINNGIKELGKTGAKTYGGVVIDNGIEDTVDEYL
jgi:hypothetical protein